MASRNYPRESHPSSIGDALDWLGRATLRLRLLSTIISSLSILHLILGITFAAYVFAGGYFLAGVAVVILADVGLFLLIVLYLVQFDRMVSRGNVYFQEISDEVEWYIGSNKEVLSTHPRDRPDLSLRVALRDFNQATRLPLMRSEGGGGVQYFVICLAGLFLNTVLLAYLPTILKNLRGL
jgi:hypothetical protein